MNSICAGSPLHCRSQARRLLFSDLGLPPPPPSQQCRQSIALLLLLFPCSRPIPGLAHYFPKAGIRADQGSPSGQTRGSRGFHFGSRQIATHWAEDMKPAECEGLAAWEEVSSQHGMGNTRLGFQCF
ncbi:hypothetical protein CSHISOI_00622 [Colletotrichum shisoi]|uniref:Uncharacterized protein n=1 Tax=Colletotrichum shisoi TaxID=2078593 RepID=A0A5Q4C5V7_9PEZI|nr:hypothetical protein CSHISOI_00622 [Colletotrichum shisoi]